MSTTTTQDRMQKAKDALLYALESARNELKPAEVKRLDKLAGEVEYFQHKLVSKYGK